MLPAALGIASAVVVGAALVVAVASDEQPAPAVPRVVVTDIVDGDTFTADVDGRSERIRLLNVDTPETEDPDEAVQCLGPEASEFLASTLPVGSAVRLEYDLERTDQYGRTLAGVFKDDGTLVNAEIARVGLGVPLAVGGNTRFFQAVDDAHREAVDKGLGLYSSDVPCTLPGQVGVAADAVAAATAVAPSVETASSAELSSAADKIAESLGVITTVHERFGGPRLGLVWAAFTPADHERFAGQVSGAQDAVRQRETFFRTAAGDAKAREDAAAAAAAAPKVEQRPAAPTQTAAPRTVPPAPYTPPQPRPAPTVPPAPADPYPGYTGPRCYEPGGKTWKPCG